MKDTKATKVTKGYLTRITKIEKMATLRYAVRYADFPASFPISILPWPMVPAIYAAVSRRADTIFLINPPYNTSSINFDCLINCPKPTQT